MGSGGARARAVLKIRSSHHGYFRGEGYADLEEPASDRQPAYSGVDLSSANHPLLHLANHFESCG